MPDNYGRSYHKETIDRALWRLQRWTDRSTAAPWMLANKIAAARLVGADDDDISMVLEMTVKELREFMEEHSGTV